MHREKDGERCGKTGSDTVTQFIKPCLLSRITSYCTHSDEAVQRGTQRHVQPSKARSQRCLYGYCERWAQLLEEGKANTAVKPIAANIKKRANKGLRAILQKTEKGERAGELRRKHLSHARPMLLSTEATTAVMEPFKSIHCSHICLRSPLKEHEWNAD